MENRPIWPITANSCNAMNQSKLEGTGAKPSGVGCDWLKIAIGCDWLGVVNPVIKLTEHNLKVHIIISGSQLKVLLEFQNCL